MSFIPVINISDAVESARENRTLAKKPELKDLFKGNSDYGKRYDNWFNDHFCGRVSLTKLHDVLRNKISYMIKGRRAIYFKESGWLFSPVLVNPRNLDASFTDSIVYNIVKLNTFCIKNKIKLYILEVPRKESVYKDLIAQKYGFPEEQYNKLERVRDIIKAKILKHSIPYIYPYDDLQKASERGNYVFFKWSHHWTDYGAFIGYCELMKEIRKDFPNMPFVSLNNYQESQNQLIRDDWNRYYWLGFTECLLNFNDDPSNRSIYNYYDHRNGEKMAAQVGEFTKDFTYPEGKYKVMLVGTSQNENFLQFLPYSAAKTKYIRLNMRQTKTSDKFKILKLYKKDILAFKPDILILSISTGHLPGLRDLCSTK